MISVLPPIDQLSLLAQVAQMVVVRASGHLFDHQIRYPAWEANQATLSRYLQDLGVGGVILLGGSAAEVGLKTQALQEQSNLPLLLAADIEEGVGQRFSGATQFPPPMALAAIAEQDYPTACRYAEAMGRVTALEARAMGLNWLLAPVVDVNNNPGNPVINVRAFGATPEQVRTLASAFVRGARSEAVLTTAKHFPGHGDTRVDSHLQLPHLPHSLERLRRVELPPFEAAIAAGVDAVMTAHLQIPALDPHYPATLSFPTLTGLLRQQLGFAGLIVTDALVMGAISQSYGSEEAAVLAVEAGADILLMPTDPEGCIRAVVEAVKTGRLSRQRIFTSLERIWRAKQRVAFPPPSSVASHAWEQWSSPRLCLDCLAQPEAQGLATAILEASMAQQGTVPQASATSPGDNLVWVDDVLASPYLHAACPALSWPAQHHYHLRLIDQRGCQQGPQPDQLRPTLVQAFIRGNPFRGSATAGDLLCTWVDRLLAANLLRGVVIYGSPYGLAELRDRLPASLPYGFTYGQMETAQHLILNRLGLQPPDRSGQSAFTD